ncbi:Uncharacterised protein [Edwardsiella tarda]|nr:Uncharacterised protein [Edwardsiella tarda]
MTALQAMPSATPISNRRALSIRPRRANNSNNRVAPKAPTMAKALNCQSGNMLGPNNTAITKATPAPLETPSNPGSAK